MKEIKGIKWVKDKATKEMIPAEYQQSFPVL
jgi:hypothetical protein